MGYLRGRPGASGQPLDADLTALANLASAADKVPYFTGPDAMALADFTAAARTLNAATTAAAQAALLQEALTTSPATVGGVRIGQSVMFVSPVIDGFATPGTLTTVVPALVAGQRFVLSGVKVLAVTRTGTITGLPAGKMGTNGAHDNLVPASNWSPSAANVSLADPGDTWNTTVSALTGKTALFGAPDTTAPIVFELTTAATGTATLTYRLALLGYVVAFP